MLDSVIGGNAVVMGALNWETGQIGYHDIIGANSIPPKNPTYIDFTVPLPHPYLIESKCNQFYWKRTA